jgi:GGDEF domain-containing protein
MDPPAVSLSAGVAEYPRDGQTIETLLAVADQALYDSRKGRLPTLVASRKRSHR